MTEDKDTAPAKVIEPALGKTKSGKRGRLSPKLRECMMIMAYEGEELHEAAKRAGMNPESAEKAFRKGHVIYAYNQLVGKIRKNGAQQAYLRINGLARKAESENVKLDANKWVAGVDGLSPIKKIEGRHSHTIEFGNYEYGADDAIDVTPNRGEDD